MSSDLVRLPLQLTPLAHARLFAGVREIEGEAAHPLISWWLSLCKWMPAHGASDEIPWCSAFAQGVCFNLGLERSENARARSWLLVGDEVPFTLASPGWDIAIFKRGPGEQPGPEVIEAPGHVGFVDVGWEPYAKRLPVWGGNQGNEVCRKTYPATALIGVRRLRVL